MQREKENINVNQSKGEEIWLPCLKCTYETSHIVIASIDVDGQALDWFDYFYTNKYQIVQCQGCKKFSFRYYHTDSENVDYDEENQETLYLVTQHLYPSRVSGKQRLNHTYYLPSNIFRIYDETHTALVNKQPILASIGIRALIESICKEKSAVGRNLENKIDNLVKIGVLTTEGAGILHSLRILGNEAAHEVKPHSESTLVLAMDVVEHLLKGVYILPRIAGELPKRK